MTSSSSHKWSLPERQSDEFDVIKAIYLEDVVELEPQDSNAKNLSYSIRLTPQRGGSCDFTDEQQVTLRMNVVIPPKYPNVVPHISLAEVQGLSTAQVAQLQNELTQIAKEQVAKSEVMVLDLAQHVESFLYANQSRPIPSFYEEMLARKKREQEEVTNAQRQFQEKEVQAMRNEIQRKQDELREEAIRLRQLRKFNSERESEPSEDETGVGTSMSLSLNLNDRRVSVQRERLSNSISRDVLVLVDMTCRNAAKRSFHKGQMITESPRGSRLYAGMDANSGCMVVLSEFSYQTRMDRKTKTKYFGDGEAFPFDEAVKQFHSLELEFKNLQRLEHPNLVLYLGIKMMAEKSGPFVVLLAQEYTSGTPLQGYLQETLVLDISFIRHCTEGILEGLHYLHSNNIVHRVLCGTNVFLDPVSGGVKLSEYGLERKLHELLQTLNDFPEVPEKLAPSIGRAAKKCDVYRLGILVLSLVKGHCVTQNPPEVPTHLPPELQDFLRQCCNTNENARWTTAQLLEHSFLKMPINRGGSFQHRGGHTPDSQESGYAQEKAEIEFGTYVVKGNSRLRDEFEFLMWLGKGGFGDVLKVRNKLDGGVYAIKRIRLNPKSTHLNKKITREVKLLSRLNHENVVRYFNSWIETVTDVADSESTMTSTNPTTGPQSIQQHQPKYEKNSLGLTDNIEELAAAITANMDSDMNPSVTSDDSEDESSSDDDDIFGTSFVRLMDASEDIIFGTQTDGEEEAKQSHKNDESKLMLPGSDSKKELSPSKEVNFMYIQMEFCEKSTLRTAIDNNLCQDLDRTWRLFREIVEGLAHIHQQGIIHRDLKPVNIFLDVRDHVKIGDFGLATSSILKTGGMVELVTNILMESAEMDNPGDCLTGHIGTSHYVAPELTTGAPGVKILYDQKVDIYSLGIIFFEMFYRPLPTSMERVRVLTGLRQPNIVLPSDFDENTMQKQALISRWLLNHDPTQRPTSMELLQSDHLPPLLMEEAELREMFRNTLANPQSKAYKYLMNSCFRQTVSRVEELTYDMNILRSHTASNFSPKLRILQGVKQIIRRVFQQHGAIEFSTPLLLPKSQVYENLPSLVRLMTQNGNNISLPHDLRVPFARYVVSNSLANVKRYAIEKVYRERKVYGVHPRELYECAFDVVSSSRENFIPDVEALSAVFEICHQLPWVREKPLSIRLGHTFLLDGVLLHFSIDEKLQSDIRTLLSTRENDKESKHYIQTKLAGLKLPDHCIVMLLGLLEIEGPLAKLSSIFKTVIKRKGPAGSKIKEALHELEVVSGHIAAFGLKCSVTVSPTLGFGVNIYSGVIYQVMCQIKKKKNRMNMDLLAAGGRYDDLLNNFRTTLEMSGLAGKDGPKQFGVGISISLDKLVATIDPEEIQNFGELRTADVVVCKLGNHPANEEIISLMTEFWSHGLACTSVNCALNLESVEEICRDIGANFIVVLVKESESFSQYRLRYLERDRFQEKKVSRAEVVECVAKAIQGQSDRNERPSNAGLFHVKSDVNMSKYQYQSQAAESTSTTQLYPSSGSGLPLVNISFVQAPTSNEKISNWKRRYENQILNHVTENLGKLSKQHTVEVIGVELSSATIKTLASCLELSDKEEFNKGVVEAMESHPRQKKYISLICDEIFELVYNKKVAVVILYGLLDNFYRMLL